MNDEDFDVIMAAVANNGRISAQDKITSIHLANENDQYASLLNDVYIRGRNALVHVNTLQSFIKMTQEMITKEHDTERKESLIDFAVSILVGQANVCLRDYQSHLSGSEARQKAGFNGELILDFFISLLDQTASEKEKKRLNANIKVLGYFEDLSAGFQKAAVVENEPAVESQKPSSPNEARAVATPSTSVSTTSLSYPDKVSSALFVWSKIILGLFIVAGTALFITGISLLASGKDALLAVGGGLLGAGVGVFILAFFSKALLDGYATMVQSAEKNLRNK